MRSIALLNLLMSFQIALSFCCRFAFTKWNIWKFNNKKNRNNNNNNQPKSSSENPLFYGQKLCLARYCFFLFFSFICDRSDIFHLACNYANFYHLFTPCFAIVSFNSLEMFLIIFLVLIGTVTLNEINLWFPSIELMIACVCMHVYVCMF